MWAAIATVLTTLLSFFLNKKKSDATVINEAARAGADTSRKTSKDIDAQIAKVEASIADRTVELQHAGSLREQNRIAASAVDSADDPV